MKRELDETTIGLWKQYLENKTAAFIAMREALDHLQWCRICGEGPWKDCDGGRAALSAIALADGATKPSE